MKASMNPIKVKSSNVDEIAYDPATKELHVSFKNGGLYKYLNVPPEKHQAMMAAPSIGEYLHKHIKGNHEMEKISE